jgi:glyoxylase-like metal-dependent hydrolase (beta-lactamase superfamily II)
MAVRVERVVTSGVFTLDGESFDVDNNIWLVGDDDEVVVVDAAHDHRPIADAVGGRRVAAIVCTHGHNDHVNAAVDLAAEVAAPIAIHGDDLALFREVHGDRTPDRTLDDGDVVTVGDVDLHVLHTPGHTWGGICLHAPALGCVFSGDTLFQGGPGATGRSWSDRDVLVRSIRDRLLPLPADTVVHTGHGDDTTIAAEAPGLA